MTSSASSQENVTCLGCGCACDDIHVTTRDGRIVDARNACELGVAWFGDGQVPARTRVAGRDVSGQKAIDAVATLLATASRPLVYLAPDLSCEAQRALVAIADALGAALDSVTSATALSSILAAQERGRASATLGELRNRADVVVFWGVDPAVRYPRYWTRYAPDVAGIHAPDGRRSRTVVAVDVVAPGASGGAGDGRGPADANVRVTVPADEETATITAVAALVAGRDTGGSAVAWTRARELVTLLTGARYAAIVADAEGAMEAGRAAALIALAQTLNAPTRCALSLLRGGGNRSGADAVATWQTGFPTAVDFSRGYPRYVPYEGTAHARLARGEVDALLLAGSAGLVPPELLSLMAAVPRAVIGPRASESVLSAGLKPRTTTGVPSSTTGVPSTTTAVVQAFRPADGDARDIIIDTAVAGIHEGGTAMRMDDVPLPLRTLVAGPAGAAEVARAIGRRLKELGRVSGQAAAR